MIVEPVTGNELLKEPIANQQNVVGASQDQVRKASLAEPDQSLHGEDKDHSPNPADKESKPSRRDSMKDRSRDQKSNLTI